MNPLTSVIMTCHKEEHLMPTLQNLLETAEGRIEILLHLDGCDQEIVKDIRISKTQSEDFQGRRVVINRLVKQAQGEYLFHVDAHCRMLTYGWDVALRRGCRDDGTSFATLYHLFRNKNSIIQHSRHRSRTELITDPCHTWIDKKDAPVQETMTLTGCALMHHRQIWHPYNELYAGWGHMGIEHSLYGWLCGEFPNPMRLVPEVICEHLGRRHAGNTDRHIWDGGLMRPCDTRRDLCRLYTTGKALDQQRSVDWLFRKFEKKGLIK